MKKLLLRIIQVIAGIVILFAGLWLVEFGSAWVDQCPTAIVMDAETGKPIEGAVALVQWHRTRAGSIEGPSQTLSRAKETFSDKDGKVCIDGYWGINIFLKSPRLTIYKPGYVIWDSREICPNYEKRKDFDSNNRAIKLLKFDNEAPRWMKEYPDRDDRKPHIMQDSFFNHCYDSGVGREYSSSEIKIRDLFYQYEFPFVDRERMERYNQLYKR